MTSGQIIFCQPCTEKTIARWKGWPLKSSPVPLLEPLNGKGCQFCKSSKQLSHRQIFWVNVHEERSTGLPNHWQLSVNADPWYAKWGLPYKAIATCKTCKKPAIVSEIKFPNGKSQLGLNCSRCGITQR